MLDLDQLSVEDTQKFNQHAKSILPEYINLLEQITPENAENYWLFSSIISRNPYMSDLHRRLASISFALEIIKEKNITTLKTSDIPLGKIFHQMFPKIKIIYTNRKLAFLNLLKPYFDFGKGLFYLAQRVLSREKWDSNKFHGKSITLVETFVLNNSVKNHYYPELTQYLSCEERENLYFLPTFVHFRNYFSAIQKTRKSKTLFIIPDDFLKIQDYLTILKASFHLLRTRIKKVFLKNVDISLLINEEVRRNAFHSSSLLGHLHYIFCKRLLERKVKVRFALSWYENQPQNKGFIRGLRNYFPAVKIVGYQDFVISPLYNFNICPTKLEYKNRLTPNKIAVTGTGLINKAKQYCQNLEVVVAPSFRSEKLFNAQKVPKSPSTVLVVLPVDKKDADFLVNNIQAIEKKLEYIKFIFKPHPSAVLSSLPKSVKYMSKSFYELIGEAFLVITRASSCALETMALGVPVIVYESLSKISNNPIPRTVPGKLWKLAYDQEELLSAIEFFLKNKQDLDSLGKEVQDQYVTRPTRKNVASLFNNESLHE